MEKKNIKRKVFFKYNKKKIQNILFLIQQTNKKIQKETFS